MKIFSLPSKAVIGLFPSNSDIQQVMVNTDFIFLAMKCGTIEVWQKERATKIASLKLRSSGNTRITSLTPDKDGEMIFVGCSDGRIQVCWFIHPHLIFTLNINPRKWQQQLTTVIWFLLQTWSLEWKTPNIVCMQSFLALEIVYLTILNCPLYSLLPWNIIVKLCYGSEIISSLFKFNHFKQPILQSVSNFEHVPFIDGLVGLTRKPTRFQQKEEFWYRVLYSSLRHGH